MLSVRMKTEDELFLDALNESYRKEFTTAQEIKEEEVNNYYRNLGFNVL